LLAYYLKINRSQGQTLDVVGVFQQVCSCMVTCTLDIWPHWGPQRPSYLCQSRRIWQYARSPHFLTNLCQQRCLARASHRLIN